MPWIKVNGDPPRPTTFEDLGYVQVVRCKDCKYFNINGCDEGFGWCERNGIGHGSSTDWYCADGERRDAD